MILFVCSVSRCPAVRNAFGVVQGDSVGSQSRELVLPFLRCSTLNSNKGIGVSGAALGLLRKAKVRPFRTVFGLWTLKKGSGELGRLLAFVSCAKSLTFSTCLSPAGSLSDTFLPSISS